MSDVVADPLLLGQRVVAILETGQRDETYKLATLMALIDHCGLSPRPGASIADSRKEFRPGRATDRRLASTSPLCRSGYDRTTADWGRTGGGAYLQWRHPASCAGVVPLAIRQGD